VRYETRGVDALGNVANFVETEFFVWREAEVDGGSVRVASYVIIRGSVPVYWHQPLSVMRYGVQYNPRPRLDHSSQETAPAFAAHMSCLKAAYGDVLCVNLVNGSGDEWIIGSEFYRQVAMARDSSVRHVHFDFHKKCGGNGGNSESMEPLMERVMDLGGGAGVSWSVFDWSDAHEGAALVYSKRQSAVLRVNCIDCLDRTNVVQAFFSQRVLLSILNSWEIGPLLGQVVPPQLSWHNLQPLAAIVRVMWFNNGNSLSLQYSGTGSLKAEVTKTGKQSFMGLIADGVKSVRRLYYSYLKDSTRQDMIELLLGHFTLENEVEGQGMEGDELVSVNGSCTSFRVVRVTRTGARRYAVLEVDSSDPGCISHTTRNHKSEYQKVEFALREGLLKLHRKQDDRYNA
jgi:hypothetical protein